MNDRVTLSGHLSLWQVSFLGGRMAAARLISVHINKGKNGSPVQPAGFRIADVTCFFFFMDLISTMKAGVATETKLEVRGGLGLLPNKRGTTPGGSCTRSHCLRIL